MSTELSRKELKQDNVALKVEETAHFLVTHRQTAIRTGIAVVAVVVVGLLSWFFITQRRDAREKALADAIALQTAPIGQAPANGGPSFATEAARADAVKKAFTNVMNQNSGSDEGAAAEYFLASADAADGKLADAVKKYDHVISTAGADYASLAKLAKAQVEFSLANLSDAQAILKDLIANPTVMVSKDQATIVLAKGIAATQPEEARKLLLPIAGASAAAGPGSTVDSAVSQAAVTALSELPKAK